MPKRNLQDGSASTSLTRIPARRGPPPRRATIAGLPVLNYCGELHARSRLLDTCSTCIVLIGVLIARFRTDV